MTRYQIPRKALARRRFNSIYLSNDSCGFSMTDPDIDSNSKNRHPEILTNINKHRKEKLQKILIP